MVIVWGFRIWSVPEKEKKRIIVNWIYRENESARSSYDIDGKKNIKMTAIE